MIRRVIWLMLMPLVAGLLMYVFFRTDSYLADLFPPSWKWKGENRILLFVTGWLPDFLWCFSLSSFLFSFQVLNTYRSFKFLVLSLLFISEIGQLCSNNYFVFNSFDLAAAFSAWIVSYKLRNLFYEKYS